MQIEATRALTQAIQGNQSWVKTDSQQMAFIADRVTQSDNVPWVKSGSQELTFEDFGSMFDKIPEVTQSDPSRTDTGNFAIVDRLIANDNVNAADKARAWVMAHPKLDGLSQRDAAKAAGVGLATLQRAIKEMGTTNE